MTTKNRFCVRYYLLFFSVALISCAEKKETTKKSSTDYLTEIRIAEKTVTEDPLAQSNILLQDVQVSTDIVYSTLIGYRPLRLDLYNPSSKKAPTPLIIFVHGGGWTTGHKRATANFENWPGTLASLARLGFTVVSVEYRLSGEAPFPAAIQDVKTAIRFLKVNAQKYGLDSSRVAIWGGSAGAHIAAMAAFTPNDKSLDPLQKAYASVSETVNGFVGWYGPYDITMMINALAKAMGNKLPIPPSGNQELTETQGSLLFFHCNAKGCAADLLVKGSPVSYVKAALPPTLLMHGTADALVPYQQSVLLAEKMKAAGTKVELDLIDSVGHGWVGATPSLTKKGSLEAIDITFKYFINLFYKK
jgi:acetyl esterase/lipase